MMSTQIGKLRGKLSTTQPLPVKYLKKLSTESKLFVDNVLNKDPKKRMLIKEVVEHPWLQMHNKNSKLFEENMKSKEQSEFEIHSNPEKK